MQSSAKNVNEYIKRESKPVQALLKELRKTIKECAPKAEEVISYGMPAYKQNGMLVYFAAHKNHIGLYPLPAGIVAFEKELEKYQTSKSTAQFPFDQKLPIALIKKIVKYRVKQNEGKIKKSDLKNHTVHHKDGSIWAKGKMAKGKMEGYWEWYRKGTGVIMRSGYFKGGKQTGKWTTYDKKGKAVKVTEMKGKN